MAGNTLVDAGFLVALLSRRDSHHRWSIAKAVSFPPPWQSCEAALSEAFYLLGTPGTHTLSALLSRGAVVVTFELSSHLAAVLELMEKYANVPPSLADMSLVRMSEIFADSVVLTTDSDFHIYRRHGRRVIPCITP